MNTSGMGWGYNSSSSGSVGCRGVPGSVGGGGGGQQLSVVATVWGVTTSTQSGPMGTFAGAGHGAGIGPHPGNNMNSNNNHHNSNNHQNNSYQSNVQSYYHPGGQMGPGSIKTMGSFPQNGPGGAGGMSVAASASGPRHHVPTFSGG